MLKSLSLGVALTARIQPKGIIAKAELKDGCLRVMLDAATVPINKPYRNPLFKQERDK